MKEGWKRGERSAARTGRRSQRMECGSREVQWSGREEEARYRVEWWGEEQEVMCC
jgi:hypothetical protein